MFAGSRPKPFRFDVDVAGGTVFFVPRRLPRSSSSRTSTATVIHFQKYTLLGTQMLEEVLTRGLSATISTVDYVKCLDLPRPADPVATENLEALGAAVLSVTTVN